MAFDPNDRDSVNQFALRARNEGHSDEEIIDYIKKQRLSSAGQTLQRESAFKLQQSRPITSAGAADVLPPGNYQEALPYLLGAPGQAMKEGIDYLAAEKPEDRPTAAGAATRVGLMLAAPKIATGGLKLLGKSVGVAAPVVERVMSSGPVQAAKTLYGKMAPGAAEQLGTEVATSATKQLSTQQATALAKDAFVENLNQQGMKLPVAQIAARLKNMIPEAQTIASDVMKQARDRLVALGDEIVTAHPSGQAGIGDFVTLKENLSRQLLKATNPVLRQKLVEATASAERDIAVGSGPEVANHIKALEIATGNRLKVLRNVQRLFQASPEKAAIRAASSEPLMRLVNEMDAQTGTNFAEEITQLAAKRQLTTAEKHLMADRLTRLAASSAIGMAEGGPVGFLTYLLTSPTARRQALKLGTLLATTSIPRVVATAAIQEIPK